MTPPTIRIGAEIMTVRAMKTSVWTCWTSFVLRVMSEAGPKLVDLDLRERLDLAEDRAAQVAPEAHGCARAEVDGGDGRDAQDQRHAEHDRAGPEDEVVVALERCRC